MKVVVIGGGPAGMMSAITAAQEKNEVIIIEKNKTLGRKLLITGKGRCNITSSLDMSEFIKNIPGNGKFLYSAFQTFKNTDIIEFLNKNGLKVKEERGNRIFPVTDSAQSVLDCFEREIKKDNIKVKYGTRVKRILRKEIQEENFNYKAVGVELEDGEKIYADKIILATGGKSYPLTGSNGDGYKIASELGHTITDIKPSIVPLEADVNICKYLQGLSLRNVKIMIKDIEKNKKIYEDFG